MVFAPVKRVLLPAQSTGSDPVRSRMGQAGYSAEITDLAQAIISLAYEIAFLHDAFPDSARWDSGLRIDIP